MANIRKSFNFRDGVQVDEDNFIVNSQGLVGIGTTVPAESLDVRGNINVVGVITAGNEFVSALNVTGFATITDGTFGRLEAPTSGIVTATTGILTYFGDGSTLSNLPTSQWVDTDVGLGFTSIYAAGNVGIATTDPRFTFQVGGNDQTAVGIFTGGVGFSDSGNVVVAGILTANSIIGNGTGIDGLDADRITRGTLGHDFLPIIDDSKIAEGLSFTGILTATTFDGNVTGNVTGDVVGTASTAESLTGTPDIEVDDVTASTVTSGYIEATANLGVEGKVGVGTTAPLSNIEVQNVGLSSIYVGSTNDNAAVELGRGLPNRATSGGIRYGGDSGSSYSDSRSLDIVNYDLGHVNSYLHAGSGTGINTGGFHWFHKADPLLSLTYEGNLGLGVTTPSTKLSVTGVSTFTGDTFINGDLSVVGGLTLTGSLSALSFSGNILAPDGFSVVLDNGTGNGANGRVNVNTHVTSGISTFYHIEQNDLGYSVFSSSDPQGVDRIDSNALRFAINPATHPQGGSARVVVTQKGCIGSGTTNPVCALDLGSATANDDGESFSSDRFMILPKVSTTNRNNLNNLTPGALIYNTTLNKIQVRTASGWETVTSS